MKVCIMRKVRLRYERDSTLKKVVMAKSDTWAQVRAKIAGAFERLPYNSAQIIVSDAELQISSSIPTLGDYLEKFHSGGRTIMGLCIEDDDQSDDGDLDKRISHSKSETCRSRDPSRIDLTCQEEMPLSLSTLSGDGGATVDGVKKSLISDSGVHTAGTSKENKGAFDVKDSTVKGIDDKERDLGLMIYSLDELKKATNNFSASNLLGAGAFGKVFHGYVRHTKVAIKVKADKDSDANIDLNEVAYLSKYRHPHVVQVLGICNDTNKQAIIMELMEGGSLSTHLHETNDLPFIEKRIQILDDAAHGLAYLHCSGVTSKPLLHLDVKSSNILLDCYLRAKVADFGLSKQMPSLPDDKSYVKVTSFRGTRGYMADEYLDGELSTKLDVYSLGVVIVETYTGLKVYDYKRPTKCLVHLVRDALYSLDEFISLCDSKIRSRTIPYLELQSLCRKTLANRENRIDMVEVIELLKGIRRVYNI